MRTRPGIVGTAFCDIANKLEAMSWEERRRVLGGLHTFFALEFDPQPQPATPGPGPAEEPK